MIELQCLSESEIVHQQLKYSETENINFDEISLVSVYDHEHRLLSEDLASVNEQRSIEH